MRLPFFVLLFLASSAASAESIAGRASIVDADTIDIHGQRTRILDIDSPESDQHSQIRKHRASVSRLMEENARLIA
jgi:endonuclease YncB( thermonuclease family)